MQAFPPFFFTVQRGAFGIDETESVWCGTNIEICRYIKAIRRLVYSMESTYIHNPSAIDVWMKDRAQTVYRIPAEETIRFSVSESL